MVQLDLVGPFAFKWPSCVKNMGDQMLRDEFGSSTRRKLAERVAWRCSFPGCGRITVGPCLDTEYEVTVVGEAAHITAAASGGPRFDPSMSQEERRSILNGIWMCRHHARLIDADFTNYSSDTLRQWKAIAEQKTYSELKEFMHKVDLPNTLVQVGLDNIFEGIWKAVVDQEWTFVVKDFLYGSIDDLRAFCVDQVQNVSAPRFVAVESQGDGRVVSGHASWSLQPNGSTELRLQTGPKPPRVVPQNVGTDLKLNKLGDLVVEDGDLALVSGKDAAIQILSNALSTTRGEIIRQPLVGSLFSKYFWDFHDEAVYLNRLLRLEIAPFWLCQYSTTIRVRIELNSTSLTGFLRPRSYRLN